MPPRTRTRATKLQKENIEVVEKIKPKSHQNKTKTTRKALADKTNSLSDSDATNSSIKPLSKVRENTHKSVKLVPNLPVKTANEEKSRPRRNCRLKSVKETQISTDINPGTSPFKTPSKDLESSLIANRPKRICKLPSKLEDYISPSKFIPVQPCYASTPILQKITNTAFTNVPKSKTEKVGAKAGDKNFKTSDNPIKKVTLKSKLTKVNTSNSSLEKSSPDKNNNGRKKLRPKRGNANTKQVHKAIPFAKRLLNKSTSFRVLEDRNKSDEKGKNLDVYEFTFDPDDEPTPQKKKRKKTVKKKPAKPNTFAIKSTYSDNVTKALSKLKAKLKPTQPQPVQNTAKTLEIVQSTPVANPVVSNVQIPQNSYVNVKPINETAQTSIHESNYASIRVEDIAADFELIENHDDINYSPVNSPLRPKTPEAPKVDVSVHSKDPLNLQEEIGVFDDHPIASSSMNVSVRHPLASPWRVEFGNLPIKWQANTYIKPNMTPAVESSFINAEDFGRKKHVYTNMLPENEPLPQIEDNPPQTTALTQPSIISFMREVAERSANKKRKRLASPVKASYIFDDVATPNDFGYKTPKKAKKSAKDSIYNDYKSNENIPNDLCNKLLSPAKAEKRKDKDCTYFGFDESENIDQENVSPIKIIPNTRSTKGLRARPVLQELNVLRGPTRAVMPVSKAKLTSSEVVEQFYDQLKSAEDAPLFPEKETRAPEKSISTNVEVLENNDDCQSVHLFEDLELIHHLKPHRKSYSKAKKVAFQRHSNSDSDTQDHIGADPANSTFEEDFDDPSFHLPNVKEKKVNKKKNKKKKQLLKKEEKEVEEWAAGFNSMCEDIEEFPLVVE